MPVAPVERATDLFPVIEGRVSLSPVTCPPVRQGERLQIVQHPAVAADLMLAIQVCLFWVSKIPVVLESCWIPFQ